jgi:hypothetical protein
MLQQLASAGFNSAMGGRREGLCPECDISCHTFSHLRTPFHAGSAHYAGRAPGVTASGGAVTNDESVRDDAAAARPSGVQFRDGGAA